MASSRISEDIEEAAQPLYLTVHGAADDVNPVHVGVSQVSFPLSSFSLNSAVSFKFSTEVESCRHAPSNTFPFHFS